ncbi:MAG: energy transducer TonB [Bacteroidales bacterium]|nr:energy transducer TonB [Bacteroidales bacterium]
MERDLKRIPAFDEIVFEIRNKNYGAYLLRKNYNRNVLISLFVGCVIIATAVSVPYLNAKALEDRTRRAERVVEIRIENLDQPNEVVAPPPTPPPPVETVQQVKYVPPVVVDTVKPEDNVQLMTADEAQIEVKNEEVIEIQTEVKEEVAEAEPEPAPFTVVEEMPEPPGGNSGLLKYIADNTRYPAVPQENNIQGTVIVKFCVTSKGGIDQVSILRPVDPDLDAEAIRVVKTLPTFRPGKQGGVPVPVWFTVPIKFQIKTTP